MADVQSVERALSVLEAVAINQPIGVGDLSRQLELPKSTVQRFLWALSDAGWIRQVGDDYTRWTLTSKALVVGHRGSREGALREKALLPMRRLRDDTNETVTLQIPSGEFELVQIERADSNQAVRTFVTLGVVTPLSTTSGGMAYLSALDDTTIDRYLEHPINQLTPATVTDASEIRRRIEQVRRQKYAVNIGQNRLGVCAVGAAIRDVTGLPIAGIGISIPDSRFDDELVAWWGEKVLETVQFIEAKL